MQQQPIQLLHAIVGSRAGTGVRQLAWSPSGRLLASASADGVILWSASDGTMLEQWGRAGYVGSIAWSPTGGSLAVGTVVYRRRLRIGMVRMWRFPKLDSVQRSTKSKPFCDASDPVSSVSWSPDGARLAVPLQWGKIAIHDALSGQMVGGYQAEHGVSTEDIAWSPDGALIASAGCGSSADDRPGELRYSVSVHSTASGNTTVARQGTSLLTSVVWSADSSRLVITGFEMIVLWDRASSRMAGTYVAQTGFIKGAAWSPDGRRIATASNDRTIHIWDANTLQTLSVLQTDAPYGSVDCVAWSPDGRRLAAGDSGRAISIWSV